MTSILTPLSPLEAHRRLLDGSAILIDVREPDEFARRHIAESLSCPLSNWDQSRPAMRPGQEVVFACRSGMRTAAACDRLAAGVVGPSFVLAGGINAWEKQGLPLVIDNKAPLEIMRQVQIAAGLLVLAGVVLGLLVAPGWFGLSAFVGAGLAFAGATGFCGMARLLLLAPWNRRSRSA
jgi:rhodanese-related sulfurtransferase